MKIGTDTRQLAANSADPPFGPAGQPRNIPVCIRLFVVTLTLYGF